MKRFIMYLRVSTSKQEHGKDAQKELATRYAESVGGEIVAEFSENASGKNDNRVELQKAIERCKDIGATLLIAKLDRLSRNAAFLHNLKDDLSKAGVEVIAADMPEVLSNTLMLSVMAGMAQHEREIISKRTKEGLAAAKAKGKVLGRPKGADTSAAYKKSAEVRRKQANVRNQKILKIAQDMREDGKTLRQIADKLNEWGFRTPKGCEFKSQSVKDVFDLAKPIVENSHD